LSTSAIVHGDIWALGEVLTRAINLTDGRSTLAPVKAVLANRKHIIWVSTVETHQLVGRPAEQLLQIFFALQEMPIEERIVHLPSFFYATMSSTLI
jgi:hypothetical protein